MRSGTRFRRVAAGRGRRGLGAGLGSLALGAVLTIAPAHAATFVVNSTGNGADATPGNGVCATGGGVCTLRAAIQEANALAGTDTIHFNIAGLGPHTITPGAASVLPNITTRVTIDATTEPDFATLGYPAVEINGASAGAGASGLTLAAGSSGSIVRGLSINRFAAAGIVIDASGSNTVESCHLGVDPTGTLDRGNVQYGIQLRNGASTNVVGGAGGVSGNVISGNDVNGVDIIQAGTTGNRIIGNVIGLDVTGTVALGNTFVGVGIGLGASANVVGESGTGGNVISGNGQHGVRIVDGNTSNNRVQNNYIGLDVTGTLDRGNGDAFSGDGVRLETSPVAATGNVVGGTSAGLGNVISGNNQSGIHVLNFMTSTLIAGNFIGTNAAGTAAVGNGGDGIRIQSSAGNTVGGTTADARNVVSGNGDDGIEITGATATGNVVQGNYVGLDAAGTGPLGNGNDGIVVWLGQNNTIGGTAAGARNVVSANQSGLYLADATATGNAIVGNFIGTDATGTAAVGNITGIYLDQIPATVGGTAAGAGNVISGNTWTGLWIAGASGVVVHGNTFGTAADWTTPLANRFGIYVNTGASNNTIGGTAAGEANRLAHNTNDAVVLLSTAGTGNRISGNQMYSNAGLGIDLNDDAVTSNDLGDGDAGPNNLQNFPVLSAAATNGAGSVHVAGSLNGAPSTTYRVEFFASSALVGPDPSGFGEGERYLGFADVTTNASGDAIIGVVLATGVTAGEYVTATATDPSNSTSELSAAVLTYGSLVVTTTSDVVDGIVTSISNLIANPGGDGRISLREAIRATNATAGTDPIRFGIPLADANHFYYQDDSIAGSLSLVQSTALADTSIADFDPDYVGTPFSWYRIRPTSVLPSITGAVVLEGYTQSGAQANTVPAPGAPDAIHGIELDGSLAGSVNGLNLTAGNSTIQGLVVNRYVRTGIDVSGGGANVIAGNYVGTDVTGTRDLGNGAKGIEVWSAGHTIGGTTPAARNLISGNGQAGISFRNAGATGNLVAGNFVGTDVTGALDLGNSEDGVRFSGGASSNTVGGTSLGARNVISGNDNQGIAFWSGTDANNVVEGNHIGLNAAGTAAVPNGTLATPWGGIGLAGANNRIGGVAEGAGNVVSGNLGSGVEIYSSGHVVQGNLIGTDAGGTGAVPNTGYGVLLAPGSDTTIGGTAPGAGNTIAFNGNRGISLDPIAGTGNAILGNRIHSNVGLGIDLNEDGVTANDLGDGDSGPNDLLNFPTITGAVVSGAQVSVGFQLDVPAGSYRIEFFTNASGSDPSGNGEGEVLAGTRNVTHAGAGPQWFSHTFAGSLGDVITATTTACTDGPTCADFGNTSEFSNAFAVTTTAVKLMSFAAVPRDGAVDLAWETASELGNLGFLLYRSPSATGPFERITPSLIAGLGYSAVGARYGYLDAGLTNGVAYHYVLEDVETTGRTERHGPVSATPLGGADDDTSESSTTDDTSDGTSPDDTPSAPDEPAEDASARVAHGDPSAVSVRVVRRDARGVELELATGGFYTTADRDGSVRIELPGFETVAPAGAPAVPIRRRFVEAVAGRQVRIVAVDHREVVEFPSLRPAVATAPDLVAAGDGTVRTARRHVPATWSGAGLYPEQPARIVSVGFQGDVKKALLELAPLRWDRASDRLLLARRLRVRLAFDGTVQGEVSRGGSLGRSIPRRRGDTERAVLARLATSERGLYAVAFEQLFPGRLRPLARSHLRLGRLGQTVAFHMEPQGESFAPGSVLYFFSEGASLSTYAKEAVYELLRETDGVEMPVVSAVPSGATVPYAVKSEQWETNRIYLSGLVEAPDLWLWDAVASGVRRAYAFTLRGLAAAPEPPRLRVWLQGGSASPVSPDHHVRVFVNGTAVGEASWDDKAVRLVEADLTPGLLRKGGNLLEIENVRDTLAAHSVVYLDRFALDHPSILLAEAGSFDGSFGTSGTATIAGLGADSLVLDVTEAGQGAGASPQVVSGVRAGASGLSLRVEAGHRYFAVSPEALLQPRILAPSPSGLTSLSNQADYLLLAPREFLAAAAPLVRLREDQGLRTRAVALEEVFDVFGHGEPSAQAIRDFLAHAYHRWAPPSPRYVLLLGDATLDPKDYQGSGVRDRVPAWMYKSSYLWTVSDPHYAAVNGDDDLPDLALGRLPAASLEQARALVQKILAYEAAGHDLFGPAVLVADDPDNAGDFAADADDIATSLLASHTTEKIYLGALGAAATRPAILAAFDRGASLVSYVGHGGTAVWASENVFNTWDVPALVTQSQQPLLLTMNCLNGYFLPPSFDSLAEALVKAEGKGAIAAFSPSGLSLDGPAHLYHKALVKQLVSGPHARLGDAILAAQSDYASTGAFPELLSLYHLLGDPALRIR